MNSAGHTTLPAHLMLHLLMAGPALQQSPTDMAALDSSLSGPIQALTDRLVSAVLEEVRGLLDVALEALERDLSPENLRRLLERADDALAAAQGWSMLAANALTCSEQPELRETMVPSRLG